MQPETYLLRFVQTEAKTPTKFVNQIFFAFLPSPEIGEKRKKNIVSITADFYRTTSYDKSLLQFLIVFTLSLCDYKVWEILEDPTIYQSLIDDSQ